MEEKKEVVEMPAMVAIQKEVIQELYSKLLEDNKELITKINMYAVALQQEVKLTPAETAVETVETVVDEQASKETD